MQTPSKITPTNKIGIAMFGASMALSADGQTAVIGGPSDNNNVGAVWVFTRSDKSNGSGVWTQEGLKLTPNNEVGASFFGTSVALSQDGDILLVGGSGDSNGVGAAWIYTRQNGVWTQQVKLVGLVTGTAMFGVSVALSWDGDVALIGAMRDNTSVGSAWVFTRQGATWNTTGVKLTTSAAGVQSFGKSVALSADGDVALIGASGLGSVEGSAWVFTSSDEVTPGVWVWNPTGTPLPSRSDRGNNYGFGYSVALSAEGDVALVGSFGNALDQSQSGAWVFTDQGNGWTQVGPKLAVGNPYLYGQSVALSADGETAFIGDWDLSTAGVGWVFTHQGNAYIQQGPKLTGEAIGFRGYSAGSSVALSADGHTFLVGGYDQFSDGPGWAFENDGEVITHVFVLMLENHSFDNIFGFSGIPGITTKAAQSSNTYLGVSYPAAKTAPVNMPTDPPHEFADIVEQLCGAGHPYEPGKPYPSIDLSGFVSNYATSRTEINMIGNPRLPTTAEYGDIMKGFSTPVQLPVIQQLATEFALCDHWFSSLPGPTFPNRAFLHGGSSSGLADSPSAAQSIAWAVPGVGFAHEKGNVFTALKRRGVVWRVYIDRPTMVPVCLLKGVQFLVDTRNFSNFPAEVANPSYPEGYTFIEPNYGSVITESFMGGSSQHPMDGVYEGELLIKKTYEAIRNSPHWPNSLLVVTYDEHGGFFDSIPPGAAPPPNDQAKYTGTTHFRFDQYGVRVPAVVISPRITKGTVDPTVYDHTSVLATLERIFGMPSLTDRDGKANHLKNLLTAPLRTDCPLVLNNPVAPPASFRANVPEALSTAFSQQPLPQTGNVHGFLAIALKTELELSTGGAAERASILARFQTIQTMGDADAYLKQITERALQVNQSTPPPSPTPAPVPAPPSVPPIPMTGAGVPPLDALTCPPGYPIKGNVQKSTGLKVYHLPGEGSYKQTKPELCFATRAEAEAAGYVYRRR